MHDRVNHLAKEEALALLVVIAWTPGQRLTLIVLAIALKLRHARIKFLAAHSRFILSHAGPRLVPLRPHFIALSRVESASLP